jgi:hypothetical protein
MLMVLAMEDPSHSCVFTMDSPGIRERKKRDWEQPDENGRKGRKPRSVGQLLGKAKWEKLLAEWTVATGAGYLGLGNMILKLNEWRGMMDGDASHSSDIRSLTFGTEVGSADVFM